MGCFETVNVIKIVERTLNCVDARLIDHGKRVAYRVFKALKHCQPLFTENQLREACVIAMLHDIGAYKTENINDLLFFETQNRWEHAIYGFLFAKYLSPLSAMSPFILFHHADCTDLKQVAPAYHDLSQIIHIADRIDILSMIGHADEKQAASQLLKLRGIMFKSSLVDIFLENGLYLADDGYDNDTKFNNLLYASYYSEEEVEAYLRMIVFSIDFRSPPTVTHTIATTCISKALGELLDLPPEEHSPLMVGAWLHDLGKSGIPTAILENPNKLNDAEMTAVKNHIVLTDEILSGTVDDEIRLIAARHHEKLDGSGYPNGLCAVDLSLAQRVVAVADIFSALCGARSYKTAFPKEEVTGILRQMSHKGQLDANVVEAAAEHYDSIIARIKRISQPVLSIYAAINAEYADLKHKTAQMPLPSLLDFTAKVDHAHRIARMEEW